MPVVPAVGCQEDLPRRELRLMHFPCVLRRRREVVPTEPVGFIGIRLPADVVHEVRGRVSLDVGFREVPCSFRNSLVGRLPWARPIVPLVPLGVRLVGPPWITILRATSASGRLGVLGLLLGPLIRPLRCRVPSFLGEAVELSWLDELNRSVLADWRQPSMSRWHFLGWASSRCRPPLVSPRVRLSRLS